MVGYVQRSFDMVNKQDRNRGCPVRAKIQLLTTHRENWESARPCMEQPDLDVWERTLEVIIDLDATEDEYKCQLVTRWSFQYFRLSGLSKRSKRIGKVGVSRFMCNVFGKSYITASLQFITYLREKLGSWEGITCKVAPFRISTNFLLSCSRSIRVAAAFQRWI